VLDRRIMALRLVLAAILVVLASRLWTLQVAQWSARYGQAEQNRWRTEYVEAPRGQIYDRAGTPLALNRPVYNVTVTPAEVPTEWTAQTRIVGDLAKVLDLSTVEVSAALRQARQGAGGREQVLADGEDIPRETAIRLDELMYRLPGIRVTESWKRCYPRGKLAAHLVGYAALISLAAYENLKTVSWETPRSDEPQTIAGVEILQAARGEPVYTPRSTFGRDGVERLCEYLEPLPGRVSPVLQGRRGMVRTGVDVRGRPTQRHPNVLPPVPGASVFLTINARWQAAAEQALQAEIQKDPASRTGGAAVLIDVQTGELLVLASCPAVDPNRYVQRMTTAEWNAIDQDPRQPDLNRAIAGLYPLGSVMKMISASAALETGKITDRTSFDCTGVIHVGRDHQPFRCHKRTGHGRLGLYEAIAASCDTYFWKCATERGLTGEDLAAYCREFGFGNQPGTGLPNEQAGLVPTDRYKRERHHEPWWQGDTLNLVIGQGYMLVTPLQVALATAAVANGRELPAPRVIADIRWPGGPTPGSTELPLPKPRPPTIKPETLAKVRAGMRRAVTSPEGTAHAPFGGFPVPVAGKTGSAETTHREKAHAWFACFAPYDHPRYACVVVIEHGFHGSEAAAPVARQILAAVFGVSASPAAPPSGGVAE